MLKLIASDVDGTLLRKYSEALAPRTFDTIRRCLDAGLTFVVASGRQYHNLRSLFAPVWQDIYFAAENGAVLRYRDEILHLTCIEAEIGHGLIRDIESHEDLRVLLCGPDTCYITPGDPRFVHLIREELRNRVEVVDDLTAVDDKIVKISLHTRGDAPAWAAPFRERWGARLSVMYAGNGWVDFAAGGKECALQALMDRLAVTRGEIAAFGDNFNDVGMLRLAGLGYAMDTSAPEIRSLCGRVCSSVEDTVEELLRAGMAVPSA